MTKSGFKRFVMPTDGVNGEAPTGGESDLLALRSAIEEMQEGIESNQQVSTRIIADMLVQAKDPVENTFPFTLRNPGLNKIQAVMLGRVEWLDNAGSWPANGATVMWRGTADGDVSITDIPGISAGSRYKMNFVMMGTPSSKRRSKNRGGDGT